MNDGARPADDGPTILLVEDDRELVTLYRRILEDRYSVREAADGAAALDKIDDSVDLVLLDRRMPRLSGDEFLAALRDRGFDTPVTMVTAVDPGTDIVDMGFDDYLVKPVTPDDLNDVVETMLRRVEYDELVRQYFSLASKRAVLQANHSGAELERNDEYRRLTERVAASREAAEQQLSELAEDSFDELFRQLARGDTPRSEPDEPSTEG